MDAGEKTVGCGFESQHQILDEHSSYHFVVKLYCLFEKIENKLKRGRDGHLKIAFSCTSVSLGRVIGLHQVPTSVVEKNSFYKKDVLFALSYSLSSKSLNMKK